MAGSNIKLSAEDVSIVYGGGSNRSDVLALDRFSAAIAEGEFICIVGPSGCGKTTFLNAVAGAVKVTSGTLTLNGRRIEGPSRERAMVFQQPLLLPWRSVRANVGYGLELQRVDKHIVRERADRFIRLVGLEGHEEFYPSQLSGGMQQRANLARALVVDPEILLLDEPFAALDAQTREFMQQELLNIWAEARKTALFVTHQIDEAIYLADRVFVMSARPGRLLDTVTIDIPRPRALDVKTKPEFLAYQERIWNYVSAEAAKNRLQGRPMAAAQHQ
jgi:NitT/TauT family transport system ATP-binding protein